MPSAKVWKVCLRPRALWLAVMLLFAAPAVMLAADTSIPAAVSVTNSASNSVTNSLSAEVALASAASNVDSINTNAINLLDDKYHLAIGDQISFQILEDEDPPVQLVVQDSGNIQVPYIGLYPAVGKTCKELALSLKKDLEKDYYYRATVIISVVAKPKSRGKIYIVGAVRNPGPEDISSDEELTVSKAILRAGGFTDYAKGSEVRVTRGSESDPGGKQTFTVNVSSIFQNGKTENDKPVKPGDLIFVPEKLIRF